MAGGAGTAKPTRRVRSQSARRSSSIHRGPLCPFAPLPLCPFVPLCLCAFAPLFLLASGCGYMIGAPHQAQVRTVHVPTFTSDAFRRGIEYQLTEAVQKEIQQRTPFRIAKDPYADTRLRGHIVNVRKDVLGESAFDDPRELQLALAVEVAWEDVRSGQILAQRQIPITPETVHLLSQAEFAPEIGQSQATATQLAVDRLAQQVVDMMETPW